MQCCVLAFYEDLSKSLLPFYLLDVSGCVLTRISIGQSSTHGKIYIDTVAKLLYVISEVMDDLVHRKR